MNEELSDLSVIEAQIASVDAKLGKLEMRCHEIDAPAGIHLRRRLEMLKIEDNALKRNFKECQLRQGPDLVRLRRVQSLLGHISREEASVEQEAELLCSGGASSGCL